LPSARYTVPWTVVVTTAADALLPNTITHSNTPSAIFQRTLILFPDPVSTQPQSALILQPVPLPQEPSRLAAPLSSWQALPSASSPGSVPSCCPGPASRSLP